MCPIPSAPTRVFVHWVLHDLPPSTTTLAEGVKERHLPKGTRRGDSDYGRTAWRGPCPPVGRHRYFFKLYALDAVLGDLGKVNKERLLRTMEGHVLEKAELVGTYERRRDG